MPTNFQFGDVELELPDGAQARDLSSAPAEPSSGKRGRRPLPTGPVTVAPRGTGGRGPSDPVVESMLAQDMNLVAAFELNVPAPSGKRTRAAAQPKRAAIHLDPGEEAVMLLATDDVYEWRLEPTQVKKARTSRRGAVVEQGRKTVIFDLDDVGGGGRTPAARARRGPIAEVAGVVRGYVLKFVARLAIGKGVKFLERNARKTLLVMEGDDPTAWRAVDDLRGVPLPKNRPARVLLFVHGTFSSIAGGFGALTATDFGKAFLADARKQYDLVIGYDHPSLSIDPLENATDLLARLERSFTIPPRIDAISHSRGALVLRSLIEYLLPNSPLGACVRHAIFVGGANGGTTLAEPDNWKRLIDLYTNIAVAGGRAIALLGAPVAGVVIRETIQTVGTLVKHLATAAIKERLAPGLSAMEPDGRFVGDINQTQTGQPAPADAQFYVVTSDFNVDIGGPGAPEMSTRLKQWLADAFMDRLLGEPNDLVVGVGSMSRIDPHAGAFVKDRLDFGKNPNVYHTIYFAQPEVVKALARWLRLEAPAAVAAWTAFDAVDLGVLAKTSLIVTRADDDFKVVLDKISAQKPEYVVVMRDHEPQPYCYAFRSEELLDAGLKIIGTSAKSAGAEKPRVKVSLGEALQSDDDLRLGEDSASGWVPIQNPRATRQDFGNRGLTAKRTVVLDGTAPRAVIEQRISRSMVEIRGALPGLGLRGVGRGTGTIGSVSRGPVPKMAAPQRRSSGKMSKHDARSRGAGDATERYRMAREEVTRSAMMPPPRAKNGHGGGQKNGPEGGRPSGRKSGAGTGTASFNLAAQMPGTVELKKPTQLHVTISREVIEAIAGSVRDTATATVQLERKLTVRVLGTKNLEVTSDDSATLDPSSKERFDLMFDLVPTHLGEGEVEVLFLQGVEKLATLTVQPKIVRKVGTSNVEPLHARKEAVRAANGSGEDFPVLYIKEVSHGNTLVYDFFFLVKPGLYKQGQSKPLQLDRAAFVAQMYEAIEQRWLDHKDDVEAFEAELRTYGAELYDELVPEAIQAHLWEARDSLKAIQVVSEEPFIPWEIVHLKPPKQPGRPAPALGGDKHFLGQKGLVRWLTLANAAPTEIRIRSSKSYYVIPDYPVDDLRLPEAQEEIPYLEKKLSARPLNAEANAIRKLLETPDSVDHFHFAGHGEAVVHSATQPSPPAKIMMLGRLSGATYTPSYLDSSLVHQHANLLGKKGHRPLVVLNACQIGRATWKLTSIGGFAHAFLARDAGAFVGTLWAVGDKPARSFTEAFYKGLKAGKTIAEATCAGRDAAEKAREGTWLAYVVYGHPHAKVTWEATSR